MTRLDNRENEGISSEEEPHTYKIFKKYTSHNEYSKANDSLNKGNLYESKLLAALNMYS